MSEVDRLPSNPISGDFDENAKLHRLGRYTLEQRLGHGAMGVVYEARDDRTGERVAIKVLKGLNAEALYRFKREFRSLADIRHDNVLALHELVQDEGHLFFAMELIRGLGLMEFLCGSSASHGGSRHAPCTDYDLLRDVMRQLCRGVQAIHVAGFVHRDVKPSNILVEANGRVVLLDFGLVREIVKSDGLGVTRDGAVLGTPLYMSPEQATGEELGPASDWYSIGEVLYEALTGAPPYAGMGLVQLMAAKQFQAPAPPSTLRRGLPRDLDRLCMDLLSRKPSARPTAPEILSRLGDARAEAVLGDSGPIPLLGRSAELEELDRALARTREGQPVVCLVEGVSGMGKTALVERFLRRAHAMDQEIVVLSGKCSERESIPYKALDPLIDMITTHLRGIGATEVKSVLPRDPQAIARLFPVMLSVPAIAQAPHAAERALAPEEARRRGIDALRELLGRIADEQPLVLYIDDLQWSDVDSLAVLEALMQPPDAPPLLLVGSYREGAPAEVEALGHLLDALRRIDPPLDIRNIAVGPLPPEHAIDLANHMLGGASSTHEDLVEQVAREAKGSPLFIAELIRYSRRAEAPADRRPEVSLHGVISHRLHALDEDSRRLLAIIAIAGGRVDQSLALAMPPGTDALRSALAELCGESLVRLERNEDGHEMVIRHDRIRETMLAELDEAETAALHGEIGHALVEAGNADPVVLSHHFRAAGENALASRYAIWAADQAAEALAFDRAAELYRVALDLGEIDAQTRPDLLAKHAEALASAGNLYDSANAYLEAAFHVDDVRSRTWVQAATQQLLASGHTHEGSAALRTLLSFYGMKLPGSRGRAITSVLWQRTLLGLRGFKYTVREGEASEDTLGRIDALWTASRGLVYFDGLLGAGFHAQHLRLALRSGDPVRISVALGAEAHLMVIMSPHGKRDRANELLDQAAALAEQAGSDYARAMFQMHQGHVLMALGSWREGSDGIDRAIEMFRELPSGVSQEIGYCSAHSATCLQFAGRIRELRPRAHALLREATERSNPYVQGFARGLLGHLVLLSEDRHEEAIEQLALYKEEAPGGFQTHRLNYEIVLGSLMRYQGKLREAWEACERVSPELLRFDLMRASLPAAEFHVWRAQTALALATESDQPEPLIQVGEKGAKKLLGFKLSYRRAYGHATQASVEALRGNPTQAIAQLRQAITAFSRHEMSSFVAAYRTRLAELVGGSEAETLRGKVEQYVDSERITNPERMFAMLAPGFPAA